MEAQSLPAVLKHALLAGLLAGAVAAGFHWLLTEPVIDRAITIEEQLSQSRGQAAEEPVVGRRAQRVGLILGFLLYGGAWGLLFGVLSRLARSQLLARSEARRGLILAAALGWSVAIFPFLKYPANPPGVGDPATIGYRQGLYLAYVGLSVAGTALAFGLRRSLDHGRRWSWPLVLVLYGAYLAALYVTMPPNPDPIRMPSQVVWTFRTLSLGGLVLFWAVLGVVFAWFYRKRESLSPGGIRL